MLCFPRLGFLGGILQFSQIGFPRRPQLLCFHKFGVLGCPSRGPPEYLGDSRDLQGILVFANWVSQAPLVAVFSQIGCPRLSSRGPPGYLGDSRDLPGTPGFCKLGFLGALGCGVFSTWVS